jgi:hypothetical protein
MVCIFDPACELLPPWTKELYGTCILLPLYCTFSLTSSPLPRVPPFPKYSIQTVYDCGGGVGVLKCTVDHILQEFYTLFLPRFRTYKIALPPQTKMTSKDDIKGLVSLSSFVRGTPSLLPPPLTLPNRYTTLWRGIRPMKNLSHFWPIEISVNRNFIFTCSLPI